jgi:iron complex transport system ATP-binding protein
VNDAYRLDHVTYTYPGREHPAVLDLSLSIPEGRTTVLLGPNGAGKSTLMDLLLAWRRPETGTIALFNEDLGSYTKRHLGRTVSLVPQEEGSRFSFSVLEYVLFGRSPYLHELAAPKKHDIQIAYEAIGQVGIESIAHRSITTLSGGEHQLLLLARALAQQPRVLLLDEPTSSLDPGNTARVVRILKNLSEQGITLFFTTHDPSVAAECAHKVAMIARSSLLHSGDTDAVLTSELLTELYGTEMETFRRDGRLIVSRTHV